MSGETTINTANKTRLSRTTVLSTYSLLLLALVLNGSGSVGSFLSTLPLLLFLPGLLRQNWRSHIWLCFVLLIYFMVNIDHLFSPQPSVWDYLQAALIPLLFTSAMMYCRWVKQDDKAQENK